MQITYKLEKLRTGGFIAYSPDMKPVIVQGKTEEEARDKLLIAAKMYVKRHHEIIEQTKIITDEAANKVVKEFENKVTIKGNSFEEFLDNTDKVRDRQK